MVEAEAAGRCLDELMGSMAGCFRRWEPRATAKKYVGALMSDRTTSGTPPPPTSHNELPPADPGLIPLTVAEVKRLVNLLIRSRHSLTHHLQWHTWRRRHQARARWFHQRTRLTRR